MFCLAFCLEILLPDAPEQFLNNRLVTTTPSSPPPAVTQSTSIVKRIPALAVLFCWSNSAFAVPIIDDDRGGYLIAIGPISAVLGQDMPPPHRSTAVIAKSSAEARDGRDDVQRWTQQLSSEEADKRQQAANKLAALGPDAADAVPALIDCLDDDDVKTACKAAYALGQIGSPAQSAVPNLLQMLQHEEPEARIAAVETLGRIGMSSENFDETAKALADAAAQDPDENVRRAASKITNRYLYLLLGVMFIMLLAMCFGLKLMWPFLKRMISELVEWFGPLPPLPPLPPIPYKDGELERVLTPPEYGVFITYSRKDSNFVRKVADALVAGGIRVWFAEYYVRLENYEDFQRAIDHGIKRSKYFIAFTNDTWAESEYVRREMDQILEYRNPSRVLEVCLGSPTDLPRKTYGEFSAYKPHVNDRDFISVIGFIRKHTDLEISPNVAPLIDEWNDNYLNLPKANCPINLGPFRHDPSIRQDLLPGCVGAWQWSWHGLVVKAQAFVHLGKTAATEALAPGTESGETLYASYRRYAENWCSEEEGIEITGLHIFWPRGQRTGYMAISHCSGGHDGRASWERRYALAIEDKLHGRSEIGFVFSTELPGHDAQADRRSFHRIAPFLDSIMETLDLTPRLRGRGEGVNNA